MKNLILLPLMLSLLYFQSTAQQDPIYSQYLNNVLTINPAYAGIKGSYVNSRYHDVGNC